MPATLMIHRIYIPTVILVILMTGCSTKGQTISKPALPLSGSHHTSIGSDHPTEIPEDAVDHTGIDRVTISVTDNGFEDRVIMVSAGTTVVWKNNGRNLHNIRPSVDTRQPGWFTEIPAEILDNGGAGSITFEMVGDFPYYCSFHGTPTRGQHGRLIVIPNL